MLPFRLPSYKPSGTSGPDWREMECRFSPQPAHLLDRATCSSYFEKWSELSCRFGRFSSSGFGEGNRKYPSPYCPVVILPWWFVPNIAWNRFVPSEEVRAGIYFPSILTIFIFFHRFSGSQVPTPTPQCVSAVCTHRWSWLQHALQTGAGWFHNPLLSVGKFTRSVRTVMITEDGGASTNY